MSQPLVTVLADYDASTRVKGASGNNRRWQEMVADRDQIILARQHGFYIPSMVTAAVDCILAADSPPLLLGGDHSLTYWALKAVTNHVGPVSLVQFDAHHDAYPSHLLNHYTFAHHVERLLPVTIHHVGVRHEGHAESTLRRTINGPVYITVDVDYFAPALVPEVVHAVEGDNSGSLQTYRDSIARIEAPVVGADVVEWIGADTPAGEGSASVVQTVIDTLKVILER